jgi:quinolinate synthase
MSYRDYAAMSNAEVAQAIWDAKATLGKRLAILGHHYQRDEVIQFADYRGDSLGLSERAASLPEAQYIVFCGVYFMAETAAILAQPGQTVVQPVLEALCPMAAQANGKELGVAWQALSTLWLGDLLPITYQNSIAEAKAFVGQHGGAVCTSSNAEALFRWALARKGHILFLPDEHLGTNTALAVGIPPNKIGLWDPAHAADPAALADCPVVVWKGFCYVHVGFTVDDVAEARALHPDGLIVVHPECEHAVVALADASGSTTGIIQYVERAPAGSTIYVGTELHLVERLAKQYPDRTILPLARRACRTMGMTRMRHLLAVLDAILAGEPTNVVTVDPETARWARVALERMLEAK